MARSPSYPQIALPAAIEYARKVYKGAHTAAVDTDTVIAEMGYGARSGRALSVLGALKQYGLIDGRDDNLRVTKSALALISPLHDTEFAETVEEVGYQPDLFAELRREFEGKMPSESVIKSIAVRKYGFTDTGAERLAKSYAETVRFVESSRIRSEIEADDSDASASVEAGDHLGGRPVTGTATVQLDDVSSNSRATGANPAREIHESDSLRFRLSSGVVATVTFEGEVSRNAIDRLIAHLELSKDAYD